MFLKSYDFFPVVKADLHGTILNNDVICGKALKSVSSSFNEFSQIANYIEPTLTSFDTKGVNNLEMSTRMTSFVLAVLYEPHI